MVSRVGLAPARRVGGRGSVRARPTPGPRPTTGPSAVDGARGWVSGNVSCGANGADGGGGSGRAAKGGARSSSNAGVSAGVCTGVSVIVVARDGARTLGSAEFSVGAGVMS